MNAFFMKSRFKSKSVLTRWAASYLLILMIPNLIFLYSYQVSVSTMKSEIREANQLVLSNLQSNVDRLLTGAKEAYSFAYSTTPFTNIKQSDHLSSAFYFQAYQLIKSLNAYAANSNNEVKFLLYFRDLDYIISNQTANNRTSLYYSQTDLGMTASKEEWLKDLQGNYNNEFLISCNLQIGGTDSCIVYSNSISRAGVNVNIFISIPLYLAEGYSSNLLDRSLMIHSLEGKDVISFSNSDLPNFEDFSFPTGGEIKDSNGNTYICMDTPSQQTGWIYSIIAPESSFFKVSKSMNFLFAGSLCVSLLLGASIVWLLLRRNYKPVGSILSIIDDNGTAAGDEFELIKNSYKQLESENHTMQYTLTKQSEQLRERYILSRLKGKKNYLDSSDANAYFQLDTQNKSFLLTAFSVGSLPNEASAVYQDETEYLNINLFAVDNVFFEIMHEFSFYKVEDGQLLLYLLYLDKNQKQLWDKKGADLLNEIWDLFLHRLGVSLTIAVSEPTGDFSHLSLLYSDVMEVLEYKNIIGGSGVIFSTDLKGTDLLLNKNSERAQCLTDAIGEGNAEKAISTITEVFEENKNNTALPFAVFRILTMNYLNTGLNAFYEAVLDIGQYSKQLVTKLEPITASSNYAVLYNNFTVFLSFLCDIIKKQNEKTDNKLVEHIKNYINEHYQDSNLNISMIADVIEKNPRYISHVFRIQTGEGLLDYINQIRINKAKEIMEKEDITMEELAGKVGYTNGRTFRRAFLRTEGTSPSKYAGL